MRTPKRFICPVKDVPCGREKPCFPWAERGYADRNDCARWKRKNREAQLKSTIKRARMEIEELKMLNRTTMEALRKSLRDFRRCVELSCESQLYGHDIEGS